jgi:hypothetical protein
MPTTTNDLRATLFAAKDGGQACDAINALKKLAKKGNKEAKTILAAYASDGAIKHMREHACGCLADVVTEADTELATTFHHGLSDQPLQYWSVLGYIRSAGKSSYDELTRVANDIAMPLEVRCHAVKCLAKSGKQRFDRHLPADPGFWKEENLRLAEINLWKSRGYPDGEAYPEPVRHAALNEPKTDFEKVVSRLEKKLAKKRREYQDLANPTDWLAIASTKDIAQIMARWQLPAVYLDFLTRFSPIDVTIESKRFFNNFQLFGASELIEAQDGYSFNPIEQKPLEDWPAHLVVIASHGGDPFVLDLSKSDGNDAPVNTAEHGVGVWEFVREADSFGEFLAMLATCR